MEYSIIDLHDRLNWEVALKDLQPTYFHTWGYCDAISKSTQCAPCLWVVDTENGKMISTFCVREKEKGHQDIFTPYGYGGIMACGEVDQEACLKSWKEFGRKEGYLASFLMQHPHVELSESWSSILFHHHVVYSLDLSLPEDVLWSNLRKGHRYEINRSRKDSGIELSEDKEGLFADFVSLYSDTLSRVGASDLYNFSPATLENLVFSENVVFLGTLRNGKLQAAALFPHTMFSGEYFISAARPEGINDTRLLIWRAIEILKGSGVRRLNLGGGIRDDDSLAAFKRRFGGMETVLNTVKDVFDDRKYRHLCDAYECSPQIDGSYFPPYWKS